MTTTEESLFHASYFIFHWNISIKKSFTIWEKLVKPCILPVVKHFLAPPTAQKLERLQFSNDTIQRRIEGKAINVNE